MRYPLTAVSILCLAPLASGCPGGGGGAPPAAATGSSATPAPSGPAAPVDPVVTTATAEPHDPAPVDPPPYIPPSVDPEDDAASVARILAHGGKIGLTEDDLVAQRDEVFTDEAGEAHVRFERLHEGLYVCGGDFVVHGRADRGHEGFSATLREPIAISLVPALSTADATQIAVPAFVGALGAAPRVELMVDALDAPVVALAYDVTLEGTRPDGVPSVLHVIVDATSGQVRRSIDEVQTFFGPPWRRRPWQNPPPPPPPPPPPVTPTAAIGTGNSLYAGVVPVHVAQLGAGTFELKDVSGPNAGGKTVDGMNQMGGEIMLVDADNVWGILGNIWERATVAVDAHWGARASYDYFQAVHGRRGIANDGRGATSKVHYGRNVANAFWIDGCFCMTYGDGNNGLFKPFVALDIAAHEMSHGVTARSAGLVYAGESGGLNEATSDIFAACVEFHTANPGQPGNYRIGEMILAVANASLRNMADPRSDGVSVDHYSLYRAGMDVHYSSGIANNFFYLLAEGGTNRTSGLAVTGITRAKASKIWYRALTVYMTSGTNFAGARAATLSAATDLFGASSVERAAVATAWTAVGVR